MDVRSLIGDTALLSMPLDANNPFLRLIGAGPDRRAIKMKGDRHSLRSGMRCVAHLLA